MDRKDVLAGATNEHFWFAGKRGLIHTLLSRLPKKSDQKILDIGAGTGSDLKVISAFGKTTVLDIDAAALKMVPEHLVEETKVGDAIDIPYPDKSFDVVVAFDVIEHIEDDDRAVAEMHRVLKPGGHLVFTVPAFNFLFSAHDKALGHYRRYNKKMTRSLMKNFTKDTSAYWFYFLFLPVSLIRIMNRNKKAQASTQTSVPFLLNMLFGWLLNIENWLISKGLRFPFGLTLYGVYQKEK